MLVTGWVLLGLEEGIKVPERALHKVVGWHLREPGGHSVRKVVAPGQGPPGCPPQAPLLPHLQEDLAELGAHLQQGVEVAAGGRQPQC